MITSTSRLCMPSKHPALDKPLGTRTPEDIAAIVTANRGLAMKAVSKWFQRGLTSSTMDFGDMEQEAMVGLTQAAQTYDPSKGFTFGTYATKCVNTRVWCAIFDNNKPSGGSRKRDKGKNKERVAWVESLEGFADKMSSRGADGDPIAREELTQLSGGSFEAWSDYDVDLQRPVELARRACRTAQQRFILEQ